MTSTTWKLPFLEAHSFGDTATRKYALIILNQAFPYALLRQLWGATAWRCCADGGANRLHDILKVTEKDVREE